MDLQVREYLLGHHRGFNANDTLDSATAGAARLNINTEHPLEALPPGHGRVTFGRCLSFFKYFALLPLPRLDGATNARCLLFGANTPWKRVRLTSDAGNERRAWP